MRRFDLRALWRRYADPAARGLSLPTVPVDYAGAPIRIYATSNFERKVRAGMCAKEPWTVQWIESSLADGGVFYDIGANVGIFSLIAAVRYPTTVTVLAFEPGYASFGRLCENIALNKAEASIVPIPLPLWSSNRILRFAYRSPLPGIADHRLRRSSNRNRVPNAHYEQPVLGTRLDDLVRLYKLPAPHHIKLDVDGAELEVLSGASRTLSQPELQTLMVEIKADHERAVIDLLDAVGFGVETRYQRKPTAPFYTLFRRR